MQLHRTAFAAAPTVVMPSHLSSSHHHHLSSSRLPRSPPTSPRPQLLDPADPELIQRLRVFLVRAAHRPPGITDELQELLLCKLAVKPDELEAIFSSSRLAEACTSHKGSSSCLEPQQLQELRAGLDNLLRLFSTSEVFHLLQRQPALLLTPLASWLEFFTAYGFSSNQIKNLILQTQGEVMTKGTLVTAGDAIMHLKALGFDNDEIKHRVVAYCPEVLAMSRQDIDVLIGLFAKFKVGVDERAGM